MTQSKSGLAALMVGAIGIVYGDIGTSVLYALKEIFAAGHVPLTQANILGLLSLLFWTLTVIVSLKYVVLVLRADNRGEGGMVAMLALASQSVRHRPALRRALLVVGIFGTALFYGDGVITPAISVLSAIEGLELVIPATGPLVVPAAVLVLLALFLLQKRGTTGIGKLFGPVMLVWFASIAALGLAQIARHPEVLAALSPHHAAGFVGSHPGISFLVLSALVLCVTGAESLYADLGHFGKRPIRLAWFLVVMPALTLNYFGQGALLLAAPEAVANPFFLLAPEPVRMPLVALATLAAIIASQALISGAFSITKQVIQLGYLPRLRILHTSAHNVGQIYIPFVNWALFAAILVAVMVFKNSGALAAAYGVAVCGLMFITTVLTYFVVRHHWRLPLAVCIGATGLFLVVDLAFLSSALLKVVHGGWFPFLIGAVMFVAMQTWRQGQDALDEGPRKMEVDLQPLIENLSAFPPARVEGLAVFFTATADKAPSAFLHNLKHNKVMHERNVFVTVRYHEVPWIGMDERAQVKSLGHHCWHVTLNYGFKNDVDVPRDLAAVTEWGFDFADEAVSYFLGRDQLIARPQGSRMPQWRRLLFVQMHRNASAMSDYLRLPGNAVVELGAKIEV
ncbi:potassium transporter Kup [Orrella sp. JC864]|uniref:potassium transporter Kup n=1 Tax=Orrella sp. JC864 TaxID=3120298 RepID=UPI0030086748